ncbi:TPA: hypothetical protein ACPZUA_000877 [Yersinia enterocolitica]
MIRAFQKIPDIENDAHIYRGLSRLEAERRANELMDIAKETGQYSALLKHLQVLIERIER